MENLRSEFEEFHKSFATKNSKFSPGKCLTGRPVGQGDTKTERPHPVGATERAARESVSTFLGQFIPSPSGPLAYLCINVHVFLNSQGGGIEYLSAEDYKTTVPVTEDSSDLFKAAFERINALFTFNVPPSDIAICTSTPIMGRPRRDSRFRVVLNRLEFYRDTTLHNSTGITTDHWTAATQRVPDCRKHLNIFMTEPYPLGDWQHYAFGSEATFPGADPLLDQYIRTNRCANDWALALNWAHELCHILGLYHTDGDETCDEANPLFLRDVFGCGPDKICPHGGAWGDSTTANPRDGITNNLMRLLKETGWLSELQHARMWYNWTHAASLQKYRRNSCHCIRCCAFGAKIADHASEGMDMTLSFDHTYANAGWAWNGAFFVAPADGTYQFSITFSKDASSGGGTTDDVYLTLMWQRPSGAEAVGMAWAGEPTPRASAAMTNIIRMRKDDMVWVLLHSDSDVRRHIADVHFSGHMICCECV